MANTPVLVTLALQVAVSLTFGLSFLGLWRGFRRSLAAYWALAWLAYAIGLILAALGIWLTTHGLVPPFAGALLALPLQFAIVLVRAGTDAVVGPPPTRRRYVVAAALVVATFGLFHGAVALGLLPLPSAFTPYVLPRLVIGVELAWAAWPLLSAAVPRWAEGVGLMAAALVGMSVRMFVIVGYDLWLMAKSAPSQPENIWLSIALVCLLMMFGVATAFVLVEGERLAAVRAAEIIREKSEALQTSEARAVEFFHAAPSGLVILDDQGRIRQANARFASLFGYSAPQLHAQPLERLLPGVLQGHAPSPSPRGEAAERPALPPGRDVVGRRHDGSEFPLEVSLSPIALPDAVLIASAIDLTERKRAESALAESERLVSTLFANLPGMAYRRLNDAAWTMIIVSDGCRAVTGYEPSELEQNRAVSYRSLVHPDDRGWLQENGQAVLDASQPCSRQYRIIAKLGETRWVSERAIGVRDADGCVSSIEGFVQDVTLVHEQQRLLRDSQAMAHIGSWKIPLARGPVVWTEETFRIYGRAPGTTPPRVDEFLQLVHRDDRARMQDWFRACVAGTALPALEFRTTAGRWLTCEGVLELDASGKPECLIGTVQDVTERKVALQKHEALEAQLRHAQKMEAVGRLSGGIAHDFNNILTVIQGHASLLQLADTAAAEVRDAAVEIERATEHAAGLTRQLLAFSRRQTMHPRDLDVNDVVTRVAALLARTLGEDVRIEVIPAPAPQPVRADPGMLDQVLLNLAVNARDAMPHGGRLVFEVSGAELDPPAEAQAAGAVRGEFVCVSVRDSGIGIAAAELPHLFEPFYTTKSVGKGTGLGLATVYGIAQQHRGWVTVDSTVGQGTTFRVYLPRLEAAVQAVPVDVSPAAPAGRGETILVVEDESTLRHLVSRLLTGLGYRVVEAPDAALALSIWGRDSAAIDLVLTDLVMPGMSGLDLASRLRQDQPGVKIVYMSGYSAEIAGSDFPRRGGVNFLTKPFRRADLARAVRASLDEPG